MTRCIVEYQAGLDEPEYFVCEADDPEHAGEQCLNAYPGVQVIAVFVEAA